MPMEINEERRNKLVDVLSDVLSRLCQRNDRITMNETPVTRFNALRAPQITIKSYLRRIAKYSSCSEECFVLALIYIDRLIRKNGNFLVNSLNVHRLMITSIMLGAKFFDDQYFNNAYFGKIGGVSCKEINLLETEFLFMINFNLYVETGIYDTYNDRLINHAQGDGQQQKNKKTEESKETVPEPSTTDETPEATAEPTQRTEQPLVNESSQSVPTPAEALLVNSQVVTRSTPVSVVPKVPRVRQRCTPPSPKFLQNAQRIDMKTH